MFTFYLIAFLIDHIFHGKIKIFFHNKNLNILIFARNLNNLKSHTLFISEYLSKTNFFNN